MARISNALVYIAALLFTSQATAHFYLNDPPSIGFDDDLEGEAPCGSFSVDFSSNNVTDFYVGGNSIALTSIHPEATWLFRATLDNTASGAWISLLPAVQQTGLGDYCEKVVTVPASWAGSKGVLGVVQDAPDGILYQCAAVNFVSGVQASVPSICHNVTGLSAVYTTDAALSSLPMTFSSSMTAATGTSSTTSTASTSSTVKSSASITASHSYSGPGSLAWIGIIGSATLLTCLLW